MFTENNSQFFSNFIKTGKQTIVIFDQSMSNGRYITKDIIKNELKGKKYAKVLYIHWNDFVKYNQYKYTDEPEILAVGFFKCQKVNRQMFPCLEDIINENERNNSLLDPTLFRMNPIQNDQSSNIRPSPPKTEDALKFYGVATPDYPSSTQSKSNIRAHSTQISKTGKFMRPKTPNIRTGEKFNTPQISPFVPNIFVPVESSPKSTSSPLIPQCISTSGYTQICAQKSIPTSVLQPNPNYQSSSKFQSGSSSCQESQPKEQILSLANLTYLPIPVPPMRPSDRRAYTNTSSQRSASLKSLQSHATQRSPMSSVSTRGGHVRGHDHGQHRQHPYHRGHRR